MGLAGVEVQHEAQQRCSCCGQYVPARCTVCGVYAKAAGKGRASHMADHDITLAEDRGHCTTCGLPTHERKIDGRLRHVFDHWARLPNVTTGEVDA